MATDRSYISILYHKNSMSKEEIVSIENELSKYDLILVATEQSPYINASIDFFVPFIQILLSPEAVNVICQGLLTNATWDAIKALLMRIFKKFRKEPAFKLQSGNITEKTDNIQFIMGNNVLVLPMNVDEERFKYVVDKFVETATISNSLETTYTFCANNGDTIMHKTEGEIIQEEYKKQLKKM